MLSKRIHHLKKKIKNHYDNVLLIEVLAATNNNLKSKISTLEVKLSEQESKIKSLNKETKHIEDLKNRITDLEKYKNVCTNDIPVMASAITELYNILNVIVSGKLILNRKIEDEVIPTADELAYAELFENEDCSETGKKKKKVYH